jgi:ribonuclease/clavin/mitogillin
MARTAFGRPLFTVEVYCVDGWLIDTGPPATAGEIVHFARERAVRGVVNTHQHEDHAGGDAALSRSLGLVPHAPNLTVPVLAAPPRVQLYRLIVWGQPAPVQAAPLGESLETEHYRFRLIPTPGHCPDHASLLEANAGWLFSGDLFIAERARYLRADEDACILLDSLRRARALQFQTLFCSHAGVVDAGPAALGRKLDYWENIQGRAREMRLAGQPLAAIRDQLLGPEGRMTTITRGHLSKLNLIRSLLKDCPNQV